MYDVRLAIYDLRGSSSRHHTAASPCALYPTLRSFVACATPHCGFALCGVTRILPLRGCSRKMLLLTAPHCGFALCGVTGILPLRGCSRKMLLLTAPHCGFALCGVTRILPLRGCSRKFSILNSQFSIITVSFVGTIILLMLNWRGTRPGSRSLTCVIFSRLLLEMTVMTFVCTESPPPRTL